MLPTLFVCLKRIKRIDPFLFFRINPVAALTRQWLTSTTLKPQRFWQTKPRFDPTSRVQIFSSSFFLFFWNFFFHAFETWWESVAHSCCFFLCSLAFAYCGGHTHIRAAPTVISNICEFSCWVLCMNFLFILVSNMWSVMNYFWLSNIIMALMLVVLVFGVCVQAKFWRQYVEAYMAVNNDEAIKQIFSRCLLNCLQIPLW